ncbi:MAG: diguanylate cyclase [Atopobiaceae bacterium]|nr:diguanylate cyclase [Atopobiaceae bacterium]
MHSIRTKVTSLTIAAVLLSVMLIGSISIVVAKHDAEQRSEQLMELLCDATTEKINGYLDGIEEATQTVSRYAYDSLDAAALYQGGVLGATAYGPSVDEEGRTEEQRERLDDYLRRYLEDTREVFQTIADSNPDILTYYFKVNPAVSVDAGEYWYSKHLSTGFVRQVFPDMESYEPDDTEHVGWYYLPINDGQPTWLDPYHNDNLGEDIMSYVVPLYRYGTFMGVIGVDVSYGSLVDQVDDIRFMQTGYAFLIDDTDTIVYHPKLETGLTLDDMSSAIESTASADKSRGSMSYWVDGHEETAVWGTLTNGLRLVVSAPSREINDGWYRMTWLVIAAALVTMSAFAWVAMRRMRHITEPLEQLAEATTQFAEGHYDVELTYDGDDEVGVLTRSFAYMQEELRTFIDDLNVRAYQDALTGVRNKGSFNLLAHRFDEVIMYADEERVPSFAIVIFDCNDLKHVNDTYGHEKGDVYLKTACNLICQVFANSPVFRLGGDEFCIILQQHDLLNYEELAEEFDARAKATNEAAQNEWETINIARGMAEYNPLMDSSMESVVERADLAMYEDKHRMKAANKE